MTDLNRNLLFDAGDPTTHLIRNNILHHARPSLSWNPSRMVWALHHQLWKVTARGALAIAQLTCLTVMEYRGPLAS